MKNIKIGERKSEYKSLIVSAVFVALVFILIASLYINHVGKNAAASAYSYLSEISGMAENELSAKIEGNLETLRIMAALSITEEYGNDQAENEKFISFIEKQAKITGFDNIFMVEPNGKAYGSQLMGADLSGREYFEKTMEGAEGMFVVENGLLTGSHLILYAVPIFKDGTAQGIICGTQEYITYQSMLENGFFGREGYIIILDKTGEIVIKSNNKNCVENAENILKSVAFVSDDDEQNLEKGLKKGGSGIVKYTVGGTEKMAAYTPIGYNGWSLMSIVPTHIAQKDNTSTLILSLIFCVFMFICIFAIFMITSMRQVKNRKLIEKMVYEDELTCGINFNKFKELAGKKLERGEYRNLACCRIDIKGFKTINDMYGFEEGDRVLKNMSLAIENVLTDDDIFARMQNDDFIALLNGGSLADIEVIDRKFRVCFFNLHAQNGANYVVNFIVGAYLVMPDDDDIVEIVEKATMAHQKSKVEHGGKITFFDEEIRKEAIKEKNIENSMHDALRNEEFVLYYQPKHDLESGAVAGAEALVRWRRSPDELVPPMEFIPAFEKNGFIVDLDLYVLEKVCVMQRKQLDKGMRPVSVSVNQSKILVHQNDYIEKVNVITEKYNLPPELIEIELTETIFQDDIEKLSDIVTKLKRMGYRISIDDFGSGYSSLNMLKDIEVDVLKIDRGFLCMAECTKRGEVVLSNIINMARDLKMKVVTEGVETENQASLLRGLKCQIAQGFLYARPMPEQDYEDIINRGEMQKE